MRHRWRPRKSPAGPLAMAFVFWGLAIGLWLLPLAFLGRGFWDALSSYILAVMTTYILSPACLLAGLICFIVALTRRR